MLDGKNAMKNIKFMFFNSTNDSDYGPEAKGSFIDFSDDSSNLFSSLVFRKPERKSIETRHQL